MSNIAWYTGVCDNVLATVVKWYAHYDEGDVFATRPFLTLQGKVEDVPTVRLHKIPFKTDELSHLIRILKAKDPDWILIKDLEHIKKNLNKCRLLPGGARQARIAFYRQDVESILKYLMEAKTGKSVGLDGVIQEAKEKGKELWET